MDKDTITDIVKNHFRTDSDVWLVCDGAKDGWVKTTVDEIVDEIEVWANGDKTVDDIQKHLTAYKELYIDELYMLTDRDCFREIDVHNDNVMFYNDEFYAFVGEDYIRENPDMTYKYFDEEYVQAAKDFISEEKDYGLKLMIQNQINCMFCGENTVNVDENKLFDATYDHFKNHTDVTYKDIREYIEKIFNDFKISNLD